MARKHVMVIAKVFIYIYIFWFVLTRNLEYCLWERFQ